MRALAFIVIFTIATAICASELPEPDVASLLGRSDAVIVGRLRIHGGICATGGIYAPEHFDVLAVLAGTVKENRLTVVFQFMRDEPVVPLKIGEKMLLFLQCPTVPVEGYWVPVDMHTGAQPYSEALETTVRKLITR